ncbi:protein PIN-LIKES 3-like [Coffea eugenioides]|uniref:protein PIN-LIKES 3-like n=1 Tax=Coffea eugenioides TaxID=49369 RepID=UPI000F60EB80|nr:protein PIN-LIKES 3-like [Coffea eugenioides]XP_027179672.1 protein PIN-LIKES 3-like [Coffea eugenioides]
MGIDELLMVALMPVLKTLLIAVVGLFLAVDHISILSATARHHLNNLVYYVFFPSLLASSLVDSISATNIISLWFTPVSILLTFIIGSALGWILVRITKTPQQLHGLVIGSCAAGNMGNLPVIIIPAICAEKNNPFGDSFSCSRNGMAYVSLSMSIGAVFVWSYVYNIIRICGTESDGNVQISSTISKNQSAEINSSDSSREELLLKGCPSSQDYHVQPTFVLKRSEDGVKVPFKQHLKSLLGKIDLRMLLTPPTVATVVGLLIGVSPLREVIVGGTAPLRVVESSVLLLGEAAIPSMTLIMGANLLRGLKRSGVNLWMILGIILIRFAALPVLGVVIIKAARDFGMVGSDPLYHFVLLLQYSVPPAMAIGTITQLFEVGETECSVLMFWNYAVAAIAMTLWATYYMWLLL